MNVSDVTSRMICGKCLIGTFNFQQQIEAVDEPDAAKNLVDLLRLLAVKRAIDVVMQAVVLDETDTVQWHHRLQLTQLP